MQANYSIEHRVQLEIVNGSEGAELVLAKKSLWTLEEDFFLKPLSKQKKPRFQMAIL